MNRLVIIGNGFDLAHGLPTSYRDFIDDYWFNIKDSNHDELVSFNLESYVEFQNHTSLEELINEIIKISEKYKRDGIEVYKLKERPIPLADNRIPIIEYKNYFFKLINQNPAQNWVDIENTYYRSLKERAKGKLNNQNYIWDIKQLNKDFEVIKGLFEKYLIKIFKEKYNWFDIRKNEIEDHLKDQPNILDFLLDRKNKEYYLKDENLNLNETLLLSFNYTKTVEDYSNYIFKSIDYNYIHGKIGVEELPIIFGFGDEMDENYSFIENIDDNEYLKNFKSIQYLEHSNYKKTIEFVESEPFQVYIMGHSCGLSDRTLLSTIFENENCLSVKVFYHQKSKNEDNYTEIVQNISRHFKDKKMLRRKVVEKRHCKPLIEFKEKKST
jgi:hypothetical protein